MGLELILKYLMFVGAFRESNFNLYKRSLCSWLSWFFVLNHSNYQRFATTHFIDVHFVDKASPEILNLLKEAVYSVNESGQRFSSIPTDKNHEQVNKDLKGSGGISDLLNTIGSLERFLVSGLITISRVPTRSLIWTH